MLALNNPWLKARLFQQHVWNDLNWWAPVMQMSRWFSIKICPRWFYCIKLYFLQANVKNITRNCVRSLRSSTPSSVTWLWRSSHPMTAELQFQTAATIPLCTTTIRPRWCCRELLHSRWPATWWQGHQEDTQGCCRVSISRSQPRAPVTHIPAPTRALLLFLEPHLTSSFSSSTPTSSSLSSR